MVYDQLFVRHWDTWADGRRNQLFVATLPARGAKPVAAATAVSAALDGDVPGRPFGGAEDYAWAPDGRSLVASVKVAGREAPWSTNFDLYRLDATGAAHGNLTADTSLGRGTGLRPTAAPVLARCGPVSSPTASREHWMSLPANAAGGPRTGRRRSLQARPTAARCTWRRSTL